MKRWLVGWLVVFCCFVQPGAARAGLATDISFMSEYNTNEATLSSAAQNLGGYSMPAVGITLTATIRDSNGNPSYGSVEYVVDQAGFITWGNPIPLSSRGKTGIVVTGTALWRGPGTKKVKVTAILKVFNYTTFKFVEVDRSSVMVYLECAPTGTGVTPLLTRNGVVVAQAMAHRPNITTTTVQTTPMKMITATGFGKAAWYTQNRITWATPAQGAQADITYQETWKVSDKRLGWTSLPQNGTCIVTYNMWALDGCYYNDNRDTTFPPLDVRHDSILTAIHETGHALGLDHNSSTQNSVMFRDTRNLFLRAIQAPVAVTDWVNLLTLYP